MDPFTTPANANLRMPARMSKHVLAAIACGVVLTVALTVIASTAGSRVLVCTYAWQLCLTQLVIHTPENPMHEGSPIDLLALVIGLSLGVPIYSALSYVALRRWLGSS